MNTKNATRKMRSLTALAMALAMVLSLLGGISFAPVTAYAATAYSSWAELIGDNDAVKTSGTTYKLLKDIQTSSTLSITETVTLDLNGFGIMYIGDNGSVIKVEQNANLTITDGNNTLTHYITLDDGRGTSVADNGTESATCIKVTGGYITGGKTGNYGGGVYNNGTFTMEGGTITGNTANYGGGVLNNGTFTMSGGTITGNTANYGGGVPNFGTFTMSNGTIRDNTATYYGGGVENSGKFVMKGGTITGNTAGDCGGGVDNYDGPLKVSGNTTITGNKSGTGDNEKDDNVYLYNGGVITITDTLESTTRIGVTMENVGTFTSGLEGKGSASNFISDVSTYTVQTENGELKLVEATTTTYTVTYDANGALEGSVPAELASYDANASVTVLGNTGDLEKDDYTFAGWNTKADGTGTDYAAGDTFTITADITLYAKWTENAQDNTPTVTITPEGAGTVELAKDGNDLKITATANSGYEFDYVSYSEYYNNSWHEDSKTNNPAKIAYYYTNGSEKFKDITVNFKSTASTTYNITKSAMTNGNVTVKKGDTEVTSAAEGDTVTLTVAPSDGYQLKDLTVVEYSLKTVADIAELKGNGFESVSVHDGNQLGIWCEEADGWDYLISFTAELTPSNVEEDVYTAVGSMGETWKFKFENFKLTSIIIISTGTNTTTYTGTSEKSLPTVDVTQDATDTSKYTFTMPATNVVVKATFEEISSTNAPTYTVTIPATLDVSNSGWNELTGGITAKGSDFADNQKLSITASSTNSWALKKDETNKVGYNLVASGNSESTYSSTAEPASWEFSKTELTANGGDGTTKTAGIVVEDYSSKPAGSYEDTVTFTAEVTGGSGTSSGNTVNLTELTADYEVQDGEVLSGTLTGNYKITVADGASVTLKDLSITNLSSSDKVAGITCNGDATITLEGTNTVKGGGASYPGISIAKDKTLTINGTGILNASSSNSGAGIGGGNTLLCGNIIINGGTVTATGGEGAAGIGAGANSSCGNITINGGTVTATGGISSPGIGGRNSNITINGGTVTATGGNYCPGIGSVRYKGCGDITISNDVTKVTATKGANAPYSIGLGNAEGSLSGQPSCGTITIGGTVYYDGSDYQNSGDTILAQDTYTYEP